MGIKPCRRPDDDVSGLLGFELRYFLYSCRSIRRTFSLGGASFVSSFISSAGSFSPFGGVGSTFSFGGSRSLFGRVEEDDGADVRLSLAASLGLLVSISFSRFE